MQPTKINVEVHCADNTPKPAYRLYLDNTLMTERTFTWDCKINYVDEEVIANLSSGTHQLSIETCKTFGQFELKNVRINGELTTGLQFKI